MVLEVILKRRSIRKFLEKDVEEEKLREILKAAMYSPSAMHLRPWEFIVVKNKEIKEKISEATPYCSFAKNAPVILIIGAKVNNFVKHWIEDCSIVAENIYLEATNQGLGTCFCQIFGHKILGEDSEEYIRKLINAPKNFRILCIMPIGYPAEEKEPHSEKEFDENKIHYDKW
jgi:nitroreductase